MKLGLDKMVLIVAIILFIIGIFTGDISFKTNINSNTAISDEAILENLSGIQNITGELYLSPVNSRNALTNSFKSANNSIKIQTYEFTKKEAKQILKDLLDKKGVDVKLIMENKKYQQYQDTWKQIQEYFSAYPRFQIKSDEQMGTLYTHSKIALIDSGFRIQTANLTHSSFYNNREYFFYSENSDVWKSLNTIFDKDWNGEQILLSDIHPNLVVCNINCRAVIENLLEGAENSILIQTQYIVDDEIWKILKNKSYLNNQNLGSGIQNTNFRFIVSDTDSNDDLIKYFGPGVARKFNKYYNHTKMILIDDKILLLGSMNLSETSLDMNREIGILIIDPEIVSEYKKLFEKDWETSIH